MESPKKQITARIPEQIYLGISKKAELKGITFTDILIEALEKYLGDELPGLCPVCHTQNNPDSQYCQKCGSSLVPGTLDPVAKYRAERDELISEVDHVLETLKPYKNLIELTHQFPKEDIALLIQLSSALLKHKDLMKDMITEVKKKQDESNSS